MAAIRTLHFNSDKITQDLTVESYFITKERRPVEICTSTYYMFEHVHKSLVTIVRDIKQTCCTGCMYEWVNNVSQIHIILRVSIHLIPNY